MTMKTTIHAKPSLLASALFAVLALSACGGEQKPAANTHEASSSASTNNITINNASEPETLDPHLASGVQEANIIRQFSEGLLSTDNEGKLIAGMATEWSSPDNLVWTFKLRDANWSNGDPVTADDFLYSFRRLTDPATGSYYASYLEDAKVKNAAEIIAGKASPDTLGVRAIDAKTLEITLTEPVPYLPSMMVHSSVVPVHRATIEKFSDKWTQPENIVVNGAYKPTLWHIGEKIVLERNKAYYNDAQTKLDSLTILPISSATTDVQRYQAGEIDITASELPAEQFESLKSSLGDELKTAPTLCTYFYDLNQTAAPFNDVRVREALTLSTDRETITDKVLGQGQVPAYQFTPVSIAGNISYTPAYKSMGMDERLAKAKQLLNDAGYNESNPLKFNLLYDTNESHQRIATAVSSLWNQLGFVQVTLDKQEWKTYLDSRREGNYQMARARWCGDYNEASTFLNLRKTTNSNNWARYSNPAYDKLLDSTVLAGVTDADRKRLYEEAEGMMDKDSTQINMFYYANVRLVKPRVVGYMNTDPLDLWQAKYWSVK